MQIRLEQFPIVIQASKKQRAKIKVERRLIYGEFKDVVILTNPTKVGQPKFIKISGNDILHQAWLVTSAKATMENFIKEELTKHNINKITTFPIHISYIFGLPTNYGGIKPVWHSETQTLTYKASKGGENWDISNLAFLWIKAFEDSLVKLGLIPDDSIKFIESYSVLHQKVDSIDERFLRIIIRDQYGCEI